MDIISDIPSIKSKIKSYKLNNLKVGLVPTMGALHSGHLALIRKSIEENDKTCCSIYVNPTQFNNKTDLQKYPRTLDQDVKLLEKAGCDIVFAPQDADMYPTVPSLKLQFGKLEEVMEGRFRPDHFNGVGIVVSKLFNIIKADVAYFGQKDLQQFLVIKQMVQDLSFDLEIRSVEIQREKDGLALSSRNVRLNAGERAVAPKLYEALILAHDLLKKGKSVQEIQKEVDSFVKQFPLIRLEYFEIADGESLAPITYVDNHRSIALCIAAYVGDVRLIDNLLLFS